MRPLPFYTVRGASGGLFGGQEIFCENFKKTFEKPIDISFEIVYNITVAFKRHARVAELADAHV